MEVLHILFSVFTVSLCLGADIDLVLKKLYTIEESIHQDVRILRESVESNRHSIETMLTILNNITDATSPSYSNSLAAGSHDNEYKDTTYLKETIERVRRAFGEEKRLLREKEDNITAEMNDMKKTVSEAVMSFDNNLKDFIRNTSVEMTKLGNFMIDNSKEISNMKQAVIDGQNSMITNMSQHTTIVIQDHAEEVVQTLEDKLNLIIQGQDTLQNNSVALAVNQVQSKEALFRLMMCMSYVIPKFKDSYNIRLANITCSGVTTQGRVEVSHNGRWGTVCDDDFRANNNSATVVCRSLGYSAGAVKGEAYFGQGSGDIWLDGVQCKGTESDIFSCPHNSIGTHDCKHSEDVGVICS